MHIAGADRPLTFYDLDIVTSLGYRVNSERGAQFRIEAANLLGSAGNEDSEWKVRLLLAVRAG
jgi:hypothetical protein